uniref:Receptor-interacting serine/threonine-protein kinase 2-like n=1 Tax=Ciona intestinalis TaxID=7719 RepID=F6Y8A2_CIOIN|nr:receptor-interacting serine/threonine-protein kinase 2-like isoform X2 [Ciona intestinalis]|eukprot:XP_002128565.1 receptor-interacting serine/threonine-protein kinase 2-like isoform X2 [Ciona intestinalis]
MDNCIKLSELKVDPIALAPIGQGSYGTVYEAWHNRHHSVAVKICRIHMDEQNFQEEKELNKRATDENACVPYFGFISEYYRGLLYNGLVFKFMECGSLGDLLHRHNVYPDNCLAFRMLHEIAVAMNKLHEINADQRLLHCDLKPCNILLDIDLHAHITDFGAARFSTVTENRDRVIKQDPNSMRTIAYCAPEFFSDNFRRTSKYDVYSFSILAWELLAREIPYRGQSNNDIPPRVLANCRPDLNLLRGTIDNYEAFEHFLRRCWAQNSNDRPTFLDIATELKPLTHTDEEVLQHAVMQAKQELLTKLNRLSFQRSLENYRYNFTEVFTGHHPTAEQSKRMEIGDNLAAQPDNNQHIAQNENDQLSVGDRNLTDEDCRRLGKNYARSWETLASDLGISFAQIDNIKQDHRRNEERKIAVFQKWKEIDPNPTVRNLIQKLRQIKVDIDCYSFLDPDRVIRDDLRNEGA